MDGGTDRRVSSPAGIFSILITSAPMSASISVQVGPAMTWVRSTTFIPLRGPIIAPRDFLVRYSPIMAAGKGRARIGCCLQAETGVPVRHAVRVLQPSPTRDSRFRLAGGSTIYRALVPPVGLG